MTDTVYPRTVIATITHHAKACPFRLLTSRLKKAKKLAFTDQRHVQYIKVCVNCILRKNVRLPKASMVGSPLFAIFSMLIAMYIVGSITVTMIPFAQRRRMANRASTSSTNKRFDVLSRTVIRVTKKIKAIPKRNQVTKRSWKVEARGCEGPSPIFSIEYRC